MKTNGERAEFDTGRLRVGFARALHKRPVPTEFVDAAMLELVSAAGRCDDAGAIGRRELEGTRQVVVVDVGLDDAPKPPAASFEHLADPPGVTRRIDHQRVTVGGEEIGGVAEPVGLQDLDVHGAIIGYGSSVRLAFRPYLRGRASGCQRP